MALRHLSMPMSPVSPVLPRAVSEQPCPPALRAHGSWLVSSVTAARGCASCRGPHVSRCPGQVKQLRLEREREKAMREQELEMLQREKEAEHFKTWEEQEDNFHLQQAKLR